MCSTFWNVYTTGPILLGLSIHHFTVSNNLYNTFLWNRSQFKEYILGYVVNNEAKINETTKIKVFAHDVGFNKFIKLLGIILYIYILPDNNAEGNIRVSNISF